MSGEIFRGPSLGPLCQPLCNGFRNFSYPFRVDCAHGSQHPIRGDQLKDEELEQVEKTNRNAVVAASIAFFLAELGDKTMLATITLASRETGLWTLFGIWLGSTVGMVAADGLAIWVGKVLGTRLPEKAVKYGAAFLFFLFGVLLLVEALG